MSIVQDVVGWTLVLALLSVPAFVAMLFWAPFLVVDRIRTLFERLPPTRSFVPSYGLVMLALSLPYVLGVGVIFATVSSEGAAWSNGILMVVQWVSVLYLIGLPVLAAVGLPATGIDWDPTGYGLSTWALLVIGTVWYALLFAVPLFLLAIVFALPGGY